MRRVLLAVVMTIGMAASAFAADVTGKWVGSVETPNGPIELTYEFKAEGETLSGTVASAMGSLPLNKGKIAGKVLTYEVALEGGAVITREATINEAGTEIAIKATGEWGTSEYVVKKVDAPRSRPATKRRAAAPHPHAASIGSPIRSRLRGVTSAGIVFVQMRYPSRRSRAARVASIARSAGIHPASSPVSQ